MANWYLWTSLGIAAAAAVMHYAVNGRSARILAPGIWRGSREGPLLALTFDDGPSESTPELLKVLAENHVRATFFFSGRNVQRLPEIARAVLNAGHEIGNHGYTHTRYWFRSRRFIRLDVERAQRAIMQITGYEPRLFRPPYGIRWFGSRQAQQALQLLGVQWSVIGHDWEWSADRVTRFIGGQLDRGSIICLHDGRENRVNPDISVTIEAVRRIIPLAQSRGFAFATVTEVI